MNDDDRLRSRPFLRRRGAAKNRRKRAAVVFFPLSAGLQFTVLARYPTYPRTMSAASGSTVPYLPRDDGPVYTLPTQLDTEILCVSL